MRRPAAVPMTETGTVAGEAMPISMESFLIAVARWLGLSGVGADGFGPGMALDRPEDFYLRAVANIAAGDGVNEAVPDADAAELDVFHSARQHLPRSVFDPARWQAAVQPGLWPKVVYVPGCLCTHCSPG